MDIASPADGGSVTGVSRIAHRVSLTLNQPLSRSARTAASFSASVHRGLAWGSTPRGRSGRRAVGGERASAAEDEERPNNEEHRADHAAEQERDPKPARARNTPDLPTSSLNDTPGYREVGAGLVPIEFDGPELLAGPHEIIQLLVIQSVKVDRGVIRGATLRVLSPEEVRPAVGDQQDCEIDHAQEEETTRTQRLQHSTHPSATERIRSIASRCPVIVVGG